ncbi:MULTISPECIES: SIR2 family protein [unclassified Lebetimonas]|uniref:SIR2 family protein n=1 Tax=unclassified Lebetimonas TaxID=2648158 RepID=UPI0004657B51|nr:MULTISPECIES: SIR2 family protein [unclassified Lebetimonas]
MKELIKNIKKEIKENKTVPYLGIGIFKNVKTKEGEQMPYDSDSLILMMNNGRAMSPRLMYEFSRAAMHLEQRRGYEYIQQLTNWIYSKPFEPTEIHKEIVNLNPKYIIDTNRDSKFQELLLDVEHILIVGKARILDNDYRYEIYKFDIQTKQYIKTDDEELKNAQKILFKPMGSTLPKPSFIISDADYVDWITEAMGGFAVPAFLKKYRKGKKYLFLGADFSKDTERMVANELTLDLDGGYYVKEPPLSKKEENFLKRHNLTHIPISLEEFNKYFIKTSL